MLIDHPDTPTERRFGYLTLRGGLALRSADSATASALWTRALELRPGDATTLNNLAQARAALNDARGAVDLLRRAIAARQRAAEPVPETWYRQWVSLAHNGSLTAESTTAAHALVAAYPTQDNWRYALLAYRQAGAPQEGAEIDLMRFMRVADALARPEEYQRFAQLLQHAGLAAEGRVVLDEGVARGIVDPVAAPTPAIRREIDRALQGARPSGGPLAAADAAAGARRFEEAVPLYRTALQQPGVGRVAVGTRLGAALALAGRRTEAEAAFRGVAASGDSAAAARWYADLARFWLAWLARSG